MGNGTPEHRELEAKGNTVNGVILSEADYLDQIRIPDYSKLMKNYLKSRAWFSEKNFLVEDYESLFRANRSREKMAISNQRQGWKSCAPIGSEEWPIIFKTKSMKLKNHK